MNIEKLPSNVSPEERKILSTFVDRLKDSEREKLIRILSQDYPEKEPRDFDWYEYNI